MAKCLNRWENIVGYIILCNQILQISHCITPVCNLTKVIFSSAILDGVLQNKLSVGSTLPYAQGNVLLTQYNVTYNDFTAMGICLWAVNIEFTLFYEL